MMKERKMKEKKITKCWRVFAKQAVNVIRWRENRKRGSGLGLAQRTQKPGQNC
jgi:hypothetical protein